MLWSQLHSQCDELYPDLLSKTSSSCIWSASKKSDDLSIKFRLEGNLKIKERDYNAALILYNKSIRYAESGNVLSLAYGNRSYCYLQQQLLDQCLVDIRYAEPFYPENLSSKLENRKQSCLEQKKVQVEPVHHHTNYGVLPAIGSSLKLENNKEFGRFITAKCDINIGDTLLIEKAYVRSSTADECLNCAKTNGNLIPCVNCIDAMYCSNVCADNNFHSIECKKTLNLGDTSRADTGGFILRSLMTGVNIFTTIDEMIAYCDDILSTDSKEFGQYDTPKLEYASFLKLSSHINRQWIMDFRQQATLIFHTIMSSKELAHKFDTREKRRFLVSLIIHHASIIRSNAFGGLCEPPDEFDNIDEQENVNNGYEQNIFLVSSYFNHSCLPNVTKLSKGNLAVIKAIQPIKSGQQLFFTYLAGELVSRTTVERNDDLMSGYGFHCNCELCISGVQLSARILEKDCDFLHVASNVKHYQNFIKKLKEHCINFIKKYPNSIASEPGNFILRTLTALLQKELEIE